MVNLGQDVSRRFTTVSKALSTFLYLAFFSILQMINDLEFKCSCSASDHASGILYLLLPPFIITWIDISLKSFYQRWMFSYCPKKNCWNHLCSAVVKFVLKYVYLTMVWTAAVLFDGDWYICIKTNKNVSQVGIPCKTNRTYEENLIMRKYKSESLDYGLTVICCLFIFWFIGESCCCCWRRKQCSGCECDLFCPPYYRWVYEDLLSEEVNSYLKSELKKMAEERAKAICEPHLIVIRDQEKRKKEKQDGIDNVEEDVTDAWNVISDSDFYMFDQYKIKKEAAAAPAEINEEQEGNAPDRRQQGTPPNDAPGQSNEEQEGNAPDRSQQGTPPNDAPGQRMTFEMEAVA